MTNAPKISERVTRLTFAKRMCRAIDNLKPGSDKVAAATIMSMIGANKLLFEIERQQRSGLMAQAEHYKRMYGYRAEMDAETYNQLKETGFEGYRGIDVIPYSRAQSGAVAFVVGRDQDGDLALLLTRKKSETDHRPPQGYFKPVAPVLGLDEEAKKAFDTDLLDNAKRELKAEVDIDVDQYKGVKTQLLGVHGHNENPGGNDLTTNAGCYLFDFTTQKALPKLGKGYDEDDFDPELPFDSVIWVKAKDMTWTKDEITFPGGRITTDKLGRGIRNDMDYAFTKKALTTTLNNELFRKTGLTALSLHSLLGLGQKIPAKSGKELIQHFEELTDKAAYIMPIIKSQIECLKTHRPCH